MNVIRTIDRYIPRWGLRLEPSSEMVSVHLVEANGRYYIKSPFAMVDAWNGAETPDESLAAIIRPCYATEDEALAHAKAAAPHWHSKPNDAIRGRLHDADRWHGDLVGRGRLADELDVSTDTLLAIARGERKATRKQGAAAMAWKGGKSRGW